MTLAEHVRRYVPLTSEDEIRLLEAAGSVPLERRSPLFQAGEPGRFLVFVETGLLRLYSVDAAIKERTHQFGLEGWWLADWEAFERGVPAAQSMQAVEASAVRVLPHDRYEPLLAAVPALERYFRRVWQRAYAASQRRLLLNETSDGEKMYRDFVRYYPEFVQRVPQYMLASFLGFTPEFLSKIRARKS
jgi:CRP-like cAMP-binding protein